MTPGTGDPILYSFRRCPYAIRSRMALAAAGIRFVLREVALRAKPAQMLEASPKGTVPVLVLPNGEVIDQSLSIMRWALGRSDPEGWLDRDDPDLVERNDGPFKQALDLYKYPNRHCHDPIEQRQAGLAFLGELEARLAPGGQLGGPVRGLADIALFPFVRQFAAIDPNWFEVQPLRNLRAWLAGHVQSPLFEAVMVRIPPWSPEDEPFLFSARPGLLFAKGRLAEPGERAEDIA